MGDKPKLSPPQFTETINRLLEVHEELFPNSKRFTADDIRFVREMSKRVSIQVTTPAQSGGPPAALAEGEAAGFNSQAANTRCLETPQVGVADAVGASGTGRVPPAEVTQTDSYTPERINIQLSAKAYKERARDLVTEVFKKEPGAPSAAFFENFFKALEARIAQELAAQAPMAHQPFQHPADPGVVWGGGTVSPAVPAKPDRQHEMLIALRLCWSSFQEIVMLLKDVQTPSNKIAIACNNVAVDAQVRVQHWFDEEARPVLSAEDEK